MLLLHDVILNCSGEAMSMSSTLMRRYGDTDFVTGLRAVAIIMVLVIHSDAFVDFGTIGQSVTDNGKFGVQIFFVIAGFTIFQNVSSSDYKNYLVRRAFRVVPVYYMFVIIGFVLLYLGFLQPNYWMEKSGADINFYNLAMHLSLLSSWDDAIAASIIDVEWTIPVEVFWYILLSIIARPHDGVVKVATVILLLVIVSYFSGKLFGPDYLNWGSRFTPLKYGLYFYLGYLAGSLRGRAIFLGAMAPWICVLCVVLWLWLMMSYRPDNGSMFALVTAAMIVCVHPSNWIARILTTRPMIIIGSVSYSIYLIHMTIIYIMDAASVNDHISRLLLFGIVSLVTLALSIFSYRYVEVPFNRFGKRFVLKYFK